MRRFLIPIIIFAAISWGIWVVILKFSSPYVTIVTINNKIVVFFLLILFFAIILSLSLIFYFFYRFIGDPPAGGRQSMRRALRQSFFVSLGIITLAILQLTKTLNPLTFILTAAIVIALEFTFRATK